MKILFQPSLLVHFDIRLAGNWFGITIFCAVVVIDFQMNNTSKGMAND